MTNNDEVEVFLTILCDESIEKEYKLEDFSRIQESLKKIKGIKNTYLIGKSDVADITAFARWKESEIPDKLIEIRQISGIKNVAAKILVPA